MRWAFYRESGDFLEGGFQPFGAEGIVIMKIRVKPLDSKAFPA